MNAPLTVACVGAGYFARFHHAAWRRIDGAALVAVADRDPARAQASGAAAYSNAGAMLAATRPDILDIATPPDTHADLIRLGLRADLRAIICQKPFCGALQPAREMTELAEAAGIPLIVHENFRFQPWHRAMKAQIAAGAIGEALQIAFRLRPGDGQGATAYLDRQPYFRAMPRFLIHETGVHWIDLFRFLLGEPQTVYADLRRLNPALAGEDAGFFILGYGDGRRALFDGNRLLDHAARDPRRTMGEALAEGTRGALALDGGGALHLRRFGESDWIQVFTPPDPVDAPGFGGGCVEALQAHVVAHLRGGAPLQNPARAYLRTLEIERAVYRSAETGRRIDL